MLSLASQEAEGLEVLWKGQPSRRSSTGSAGYDDGSIVALHDREYSVPNGWGTSRGPSVQCDW